MTHNRTCSAEPDTREPRNLAWRASCSCGWADPHQHPRLNSAELAHHMHLAELAYHAPAEGHE